MGRGGALNIVLDNGGTSHDRITESSLFNNTRGPCDWGGGVTRTATRTPASVQKQTPNRATILRDGSLTGSASLSGHKAQHWTCFRTQKKKKNDGIQPISLRKPQKGLFRESTKYAPLCVGNLIAI